MPSHDFVFALEFSSQGAPVSLVEDSASQVLSHVGCTVEVVPGLTAAFESAVAENSDGGHRRCDVQFRAHGGTLEVLISSNGGRVWQRTLKIP